MYTVIPGRLGRMLLAALTAMLALVLAAPAAAQMEASPGDVLVMEVRGPITQVTSDHLMDAVTEAEATEAAAILLQLDTPGGALETTRNMVQTMLLSEVPIIVHVEPSGSRAGSAGTFITYAAHVAAMAPGTTIGAATPVGAQGGEVIDKIIEDTASYAESLAEQRGRDVDFAREAVVDGRSITAEAAAEIGAIDLLADTREELLSAVDGEEVPLGTGETVTLETADAGVTEFEMTFARSILQALANPELAFIFISIGTLAVIYELANPGAGIGGTIGAIMLILAFYSLSVLPTNFAGVALLLLAIGLLIAELFAPGVGVLAGGGALALLFAGLLLFDRTTGVAVSWWVLVPTVALAAAGAVGIAIMAARERNRPPALGEGAMIGKRAEVRVSSNDYTQVFVDGALWQADTAGQQLKQGTRVRIVGQDGLTLHVEPEEQ